MTAILSPKISFDPWVSFETWMSQTAFYNQHLLQHMTEDNHYRKQVELVAGTYDGRLRIRDLTAVHLIAGVLTVQMAAELCVHSTDRERAYWEAAEQLQKDHKTPVCEPYNPVIPVVLMFPIILPR